MFNSLTTVIYFQIKRRHILHSLLLPQRAMLSVTLVFLLAGSQSVKGIHYHGHSTIAAYNCELSLNGYDYIWDPYPGLWLPNPFYYFDYEYNNYIGQWDRDLAWCEDYNYIRPGLDSITYGKLYKALSKQICFYFCFYFKR